MSEKDMGFEQRAEVTECHILLVEFTYSWTGQRSEPKNGPNLCTLKPRGVPVSAARRNALYIDRLHKG